MNTTRNSLKPQSEHSIHSCIFTAITSPAANGGVINLHHTSKSTIASLTVDDCCFHVCNSTGTTTGNYGGGAIYIDCGSLFLSSSLFIQCNSKLFGGAVYVYNNCETSKISRCSFITCQAEHGGAVMTHMGPTSSICSCCFISCKALQSGGGFYHNSNTTSSSLTLSDSLFSNNCAAYHGDRGGGGFEDHRGLAYSSKYSFAFFTGNTSPSGVGNDISIHFNELSTQNIIHCFTKTTSHSLWNTKYTGYDNWLPLDNIESPKNLKGKITSFL